MPKVDGGPISLAKYAAHRGCSVTAVSNAVRENRLVRSVVRIKNQPKIADVALADQEWAANTGRVGGGGGKKSPGRIAVPANEAPPDEALGIQEVIHPGEVISASTLLEAQRIATLERARKLRFENDLTEGRIVLVSTVTKELFEINRIVRETVMNVPARIAGELAADADAGSVHLKLERALREALSTAATTLRTTPAAINQ